jgi:predicted regulator of Ras-like GTPase activity (Roadblock/LC7/MglB family)
MAPGVVTEDQSRQLTTALSDLSVLTEASSAFLTDYGGNIIAQVSSSGDETAQTVAALAAGSFSATRELAGMIGEPTFSSVFHKGEQSSIFIQSIAQTFLILVVFGRNTAVGLVKLYVEKACQEIEPLLKNMRSQGVAAQAKAKPFEMTTGAPIFKKPTSG